MSTTVKYLSTGQLKNKRDKSGQQTLSNTTFMPHTLVFPWKLDGTSM